MERTGSPSARAEATRQRSFRWAAGVFDLLEARATEVAVSPNSLGERIMYEGLRTLRHPLVGFRQDTTGRRRPALIGTRLYLYQVVQTIRDGGNRLSDAAEYLGLSTAQIEATAAYYADYRDEVDADREEALAYLDAERARWERTRQAFA